MPICQNQEPICRCIDWQDEDFDVEVDHFIRNFEFRHIELEYTALDAKAPVRLCSIGRCRVCGGRMCDGTTLSDGKTAREELSYIYLLASQAHRRSGAPLPSGMSHFCDLFLTLFHQEDRETVRRWLDSRENREDHRTQRRSREEGC